MSGSSKEPSSSIAKGFDRVTKLLIKAHAPGVDINELIVDAFTEGVEFAVEQFKEVAK